MIRVAVTAPNFLANSQLAALGRLSYYPNRESRM